MKNKKENLTACTIIIIMVAITSGLVGWVLAKKVQVSSQQEHTSNAIAMPPTIHQYQSSTSKSESNMSGVDCANQQTQTELNFCADQELERTDKRLQNILDKISILNKSILSSQTYWQQYRDQYCHAIGDLYEGGSIRPLAISTCLAKINNERASDLENLYQNELNSGRLNQE